MFGLIKISMFLKTLFSRGCIWELNMLLENFWSDWIQLDLINTLPKIFAWMSPLFFDVSRRDLAMEEEGDCLENFHVGKILIGIIRILGRQNIAFRGVKSQSQRQFQPGCCVYGVVLLFTEEVSR